MSQQTKKKYVFGVGLMGTGTERLRDALEKLYDKKCFHGPEGAENTLELFLKNVENSSNNDQDDSEKTLVYDRAVAKLYEELFADNLGAVGVPACFHYKNLLKEYPKAKFVLTQIDEETWLKTVRRCILPREAVRCSLGYWIVNKFSPIACPVQQLTKLMRYYQPNVEFNPRSDQNLRELFRSHQKKVRQTVPFSQLLIFKPKEGWETLCTFLGEPIPDEKCPAVNSEEKKALISPLKKVIIYSVDVGIPLSVIGTIGLGVYLHLKGR